MSEPLKIFQAIANIMYEIESIAKDKKNIQQGFMFRGIDDVYNAVHPLFAKHKVFTTSEIINKDSTERQTAKGGTLFYEKYDIRYHFYTIDGSSLSTEVIGIGMDSGDKAGNKAMAIAHKYAIIQMFAIPTQETNDPDAETPPKIKPPVKTQQYSTQPPKQYKQKESQNISKGTLKTKVFDLLKSNKIDDLKKADYFKKIDAAKDENELSILFNAIDAINIDSKINN